MPPKKTANKGANTKSKKKEVVQEVVQEVIVEETEGDDDEDDDEGSYFIDEAGNYYYRATKDSEPVLTEPPEGFENEYVAADEVEEYETIVEELEPPKAERPVRASTRSRKRTAETLPEEDTKSELVGFYVDEVDEGGDGQDEEEHLDEDEEAESKVN